MTARAALIRVQIARRELRLDDGTYRAMLERLTGRTSSADCTEAQLDAVVAEMKAKGWKPASGGRGRRPCGASRPDAPARKRLASSPMARKARAMWISLYQLGVVRDPSERALERFGRRQLGVDRLEWADQDDAYRLIEALKAMAERAGWSQDVAGLDAETATAILKQRLDVLIDARKAG